MGIVRSLYRTISYLITRPDKAKQQQQADSERACNDGVVTDRAGPGATEASSETSELEWLISSARRSSIVLFIVG